MGWRSGFQTIVQTLYPASCLLCSKAIESQAGLCSSCWATFPFIAGLTCNTCGSPLEGSSNVDEHCDDCIKTPRPWSAARACLIYEQNARRLVWDLKYRDRPEIATAAGSWLLVALRPILPKHPLVAPVPLYWTRLLKRKFNQSALLSHALCKTGHFEHAPTLLSRVKHTPTLLGLDREEREACLTGAIEPHTKYGARAKGRNVVLVDDVMTTGATLSASTEACFLAGAKTVTAVFLARAAKNG